MSRIGKKPIPKAAGVTVSIKGQDVAFKGPKGELTFRAHEDIVVAEQGGELVITPRHDNPRAKALWGMTRAILANNMKGVSQGFEQNMELVGVGYRAAMEGTKLKLQLGFSHDVYYTPPDGVKIESAKPTEIKIIGADKQVIGQVASEIRGYRPPEPYKGKGVKRAGEYVRRKEGKKK
jgi:large subunit ribosomal protein L6